MEYQIKDVTDVEKEVTIQIPAAELQPHFEKAYKQSQTQIEVKGFRKGKVPMSLIKQRFGEAIEYDSISEIANETFRTVVEEKKLEPLGDPSLVNIDYKRGSELTFTVKYEVKPPVTLKEYKNLPVEKITHEVTDLEVEQELDRLRQSNSTLVAAERADGDQYVLTADVQELDESGTPIIGKRQQDMKVNLSDANLYAEVRQALTGAAVGDARRAKFEVAHGDHNHKNHLEFTVKGVEKITLPELNDEFVKKVTKDKVTTVEDFREQLRNDLESYWAEQSERHLADSLIGELVKRHEFNVPETIIKAITDSQIQELAGQYPNKKLPRGFDEERYRKEFRETAVWQAKWFLIRDEIIKTENITADDADLEHRAEEDAPKMGIDKERLLTFYKSSQAVKDRIVTDRLMDFLKANAQINEIDDRTIQPDPAQDAPEPQQTLIR